MQVNLTFAPGTTLQQMISFETAGRLWASHLTDNAAINIHVEPSSILPVGVAGGALLGVQPDQSYNTWRNRLSADRKTTDDQTVHQNLPSNLTSFTASVDGVSQTSSTINLSRANAKALGMRGTQNSGLDGYILMNNQLSTLGLSWNYNLGTIPANTVDFLSVAVHEIGHVLGFYSGVDASGWLLDGITGFEEDEEEDEEDFDQDPRGSLRNATSLDMFRFSDRGTINLSQGGTPYFSLNSGRTQLGLFSTGTGPDGDGFQASHWKSRSTPFEIMEPDIDLAQRRRIINLDRRAMDVIGWDLGTSSVTLSSLQTQARQSLAARIGVTVAWLNANPVEAAQRLSQDRTQAVSRMVTDSQIYEWRRTKRTQTTGFWHEIDPTTLSQPAATDPLTGFNTRSITGSSDRLTAGGQRTGSNSRSNSIASENPSLSQSGATSLPSQFTDSTLSLMAITPLSTPFPLSNQPIGTELIGTQLLQPLF
jgi:hypothetical protein